MVKQSGELCSPPARDRKDRGAKQTPSKGQPPVTPTRTVLSPMQCGSPGHAARGAAAAAPAAAGPSSTAAGDSASISPAAWERCCGILREALVDTGSQAATLVPLRPSLRRIKDDLVRVLNEAVSSQNGNASLLVLGPPGTGKTLVVERALQEVCDRHNGPISLGNPTAATSTAGPAGAAAAPAPATASGAATDGSAAVPAAAAVRNVGVVRLNGLLQPDERTAFQEVAKQLCREFGQKFIKSATFDDNLVFLKGMLHALYKCLKKVVFVVDEFQQYAKKGKQQMLYYLLDMLQDSKIQAAVIGISSAHNVAEDLEKRVLSRVGRRRVLVTFPAPAPGADEIGGGPSGRSPGGSAARSPGGAGGSNGGGASTSTPSSSAADSYPDLMYDMLAMHPGMAGLAGLEEQAAAAAAHNRALGEAMRDARVVACLEKLSLMGSPPQHLALVAEVALAGWAEDLRRQAGAEGQPQAGSRRQAPVAASATLGARHLVEALRTVTDAPERALVDVVAGLPVLSLVLLVAAHRLQRKGQPMCNFEMAWDEYRSIQGQRGAIAFSKEAAAAAWQALPLSGLAHYADANVEARGRDLNYAGVVLLLGSSELDQGIKEHPHCPDAVLRFHMQEI